MALNACKLGVHEECISSLVPERRDCDCRCHKQAIDPSHKPTARESRVSSRAKNWRGSKWYVNAFPKDAEVQLNEAVAMEYRPLTKEEAWEKFVNETRM